MPKPVHLHPVDMHENVRMAFLRVLGTELERVYTVYRRHTPPHGTIPVGGGEWMDAFFRIEALEGAMESLRVGDSISMAIEKGKKRSSQGVNLWNSKREYQVHRHPETAHMWLERCISYNLKKFKVGSP